MDSKKFTVLSIVIFVLSLLVFVATLVLVVFKIYRQFTKCTQKSKEGSYTKHRCRGYNDTDR